MARAAGTVGPRRPVGTARPPAGPDLLALRALTRRSTATLLGVAPDPAAAWRHGDAAVVAALAAVELAALGLRREGAGQPVTVTRRVSVMTGRPAPSDGSSSATRIS